MFNMLECSLPYKLVLVWVMWSVRGLLKELINFERRHGVYHIWKCVECAESRSHVQMFTSCIVLQNTDMLRRLKEDEEERMKIVTNNNMNMQVGSSLPMEKFERANFVDLKYK